jgi:hypothetical protein
MLVVPQYSYLIVRSANVRSFGSSLGRPRSRSGREVPSHVDGYVCYWHPKATLSLAEIGGFRRRVTICFQPRIAAASEAEQLRRRTV